MARNVHTSHCNEENAAEEPIAYIRHIEHTHFQTMIRRRHSYKNSKDTHNHTHVYTYLKAIIGFFMLTKNDIPRTYGSHLSGMLLNLLELYMEIPWVQNKVPATERKSEPILCMAILGSFEYK